MILDFSARDLYNYKYIPLLSETKRYVFLLGGRGSGKSRFQAQKEIIQTFEKGSRMLAIRKVERTIKDSVYAELCKVISEWNLEDCFDIKTSPMRITNKMTGSDIIFRGMDDPMKVKSIHGVSRVWIEEALELEKRDFDTVDLSIRGMRNMQITCTFNPGIKGHWLNADFWERGETEKVKLLHTTFQDNRFIGAEYREVLERLKENKWAYEIQALGMWGDHLEGLIYAYTVVNGIPKEARLLGYGLDFGYNHPACLVSLYEWNDGIVIHEEFHRPGMINADIVAYLEENKIDPYSDIIADNSRPEAIEEIYRSGFNCKPCKKGPDSVIHGVNAMKRLKLYITADSSSVRKDFDNYVWATDKSEKPTDKPIKAWDEGPDASRYFLASYFDFSEFDITFG